MPEPVTVWAVEFGSEGSSEDTSGELALGSDALTFTPGARGGPHLSIPLGSISRVRRLRGSPVLMVSHQQGGNKRRTAFYFAQPPPLQVLTGSAAARPKGGLAGLRNPKRKARRDNVGYLGMANRQKKSLVSEWLRAVRDAARAA